MEVGVPWTAPLEGTPRRTSPSPSPAGTGPALLPGHAVFCAKEPQPIPESIRPPLNGRGETMAGHKHEHTQASSLGVIPDPAKAQLRHPLPPTRTLSEEPPSPWSHHRRCRRLLTPTRAPSAKLFQDFSQATG